MQDNYTWIFVALVAIVGAALLARKYLDKLSFNAEQPSNGRAHPAIAKALGVVATSPELWALLEHRQIVLANNLRSGKIKAWAVARKGVIYISRERLAGSSNPWKSALGAILHEQLHINEGHKGQSAGQEAAAKAYRDKWFALLEVDQMD